MDFSTAFMISCVESMDRRIGVVGEENVDWIKSAAYDLPELFGPVSTVSGMMPISPFSMGPKFLTFITPSGDALWGLVDPCLGVGLLFNT